MIRNELSYIEKGDHLKRRKEIYEELYPESKAENIRNAELKQNRGDLTAAREKAISFTEDTSIKTGISARTIQKDIQIATNLENVISCLFVGSNKYLGGEPRRRRGRAPKYLLRLRGY